MKISGDETSAHPSGGKRDTAVGDWILCSEWTHEKAWWLGVTFGDGHNTKRGHSVFLKANDKDLVDKWARIAGAPAATKTKAADAWEATAYRKDLSDWVASFGMKGKKDDSLRWPDSLPEEFNADFVRGLWDTDGSVENKIRPDRDKRRLRVSFTSKSSELVDAVVKFTPGIRRRTDYPIKSGPYAGNIYPTAVGQGKFAVEAVSFMYAQAPEHIRCERKYRLAVDYLEWLSGSVKMCERCQVREVVDRSLCRHCCRVKYDGAVCACGNSPVIAKGLCRRCYSRNRAASVPQEWNNDDADKLAAYPSVDWKNTTKEDRDNHVSEILKIFRKNGFPWMAVKRPLDTLVLSRVCESNVVIDGDVITSAGRAGQDFCQTHHWHRMTVAVAKGYSAVDTFNSDTRLKHAIRLQLKGGDPVTPGRVLNAVKAVSRAPTNFPPSVARWLVDEFCPEGGRVFDPCSGYGGRLLGALASYRGVFYVGNDIEPQTVAANRAMIETLGAGSRAIIHEGSMEGLEWPLADFLMTSPPYFDKETYGEASKANLSPFRDVDEWSERWLRLLIERCVKHARTSAICISPVRYDGNVIDLPSKVAEYVELFGGIVVRRMVRRISKFGRNPMHDQIVVFSAG